MNKKEAVAVALNLYPNWVAQDKDGEWWAFMNEPRLGSFAKWAPGRNDNTEDFWQLSKSDGKKHPNWEQSLTEVKRND